MSLSSVLTAIWTISHSLLYGFHISSLNGVQDSVICGSNKSNRKYGLVSCLDITDAQFGVIVTIFTLGGLLGSLSADTVTRRFGRIGTLRFAEMGLIGGTILVGASNVMALLIIGRLIIGFSSGLVMVSVPLYLAEIATEERRTIFGTLHQIAIGLGMIIGQSLSIPFGQPWKWRAVLLVGLGIALIVFLAGLLVPKPQQTEDKSTEDEDADEETPLVSRENDDTKDEMSVKELFTTPKTKIRRALYVVVAAQLSQQICGISPVMYFSTRILSSVFHGNSKLVTLGIMGIGIPFNFVPGLLPNSFGSRRLLITSAMGTAISSILLAIGLNTHAQALSGVGVVAFVLSFSIGLAPMAWVVLSEVMPPKARTSGGAVGVSVNWLVNFAMGSSFLPLQQALMHGDQGEGNVFFFFAATSALAVVSIWTTFKLLAASA
ncbi:putative vacuolar membrane protein [Naematelia encephala]|uniref:Putative vacuolar membrane protein n=1 Tax=Naematelia encephala TaxID=71784 RepID=A0A1Y2AX11_9TREE|nr:putative vacuolar membrane protein [Naematelia encephala]